MLKTFVKYICVFAITILCLSSCSLTKRVADKDLVYMGTELDVVDKENSKTVDQFDFSINKIPPTGTRTGLGNVYTGLYNIYESTDDKGFKHWVKYKLGEEPVVFEKSMLKSTEAKLSYYLNGKGFFNHNVKCDSTRDDRKVNMLCSVMLNNRYTIDSIIFPVDSTYAALKLDDRLKRAIIKEGRFYDRDRLDYERTRLATMAGDMGFAEFGADNIYYYVDTASTDHTVDIYTQVITPTDSTSHTRFTLEQINVYPNYTLDNENSSKLEEEKIREGIIVHELDHYIDHDLLNRLILENPDTFYSRTLERKSVNRLLDLGLFRFINVNNVASGAGHNGKIIQNIYLTPERMQSVSGELEVNNRSGNFFGLGASTSYGHKNIFGHAEQLKLSLGGQVEAQFGDELSFINSADVNLSGELNFPRFIIPFFDVHESRNYIPRTVINSSYKYQRRIEYYTFQVASAKFGYRWKETSRKTHEFYPLNLDLVRVTDKTSEFQALLDNNPRLGRSFENVLIAGLQYYFTYSDQSGRGDRNYDYFRGELETSGNLIGLISSGNSDDPSQFGGTTIAQFSKITLDYRRYFPAGDTDVATRIILGGGFAYGNSKELPYVEQYLIGGSNSVRAFRLRGIGPGSFVTDPTGQGAFEQQFVDQTGDMKIEINVEWRFPLFSYLKGAIFTDAGNIWLIDNDDISGGNFAINRFYKEIGIGVGLGFRLDFDFFLIRMDLAFPIRSPKYQEGFRWRVEEIDLFDSSWRNDNLRYNLGIGYPF